VAEVKRRVPELEVVWRAYELRPEPVPTLDPGGEYLSRVWAQSVYPMAQRLNVEMRLPPIQPRSRLAHEAAAWARARGRFEQMNEAIFRAFFERGEDISDAATLGRLAESAGLDSADLARSLDAHEHLPEVLADERRAEEYGLRGVPAFVAGGALLFGVQQADALEELARLAGKAGRQESRGPLIYMPVKLKR
jgi:predicted DsbA family dithiol-disulfide isomerase